MVGVKSANCQHEATKYLQALYSQGEENPEHFIPYYISKLATTPCDEVMKF